jgi:Spy/CpxP family protein refolding chaperone
MKTKLLLVAVSCLFFFSLTGYAQMAPPAQMQQSLAGRQGLERLLKTGNRMFWDGRFIYEMAVDSLIDPEIRSALGVSDEQHREIQAARGKAMSAFADNPEIEKLHDEIRAIYDFDDPFMLKADEETAKKFWDMQDKVRNQEVIYMSDALDKILPPELKQKVNESHLAIMGEMPIIAPNMFEALNLTDAQKQQMKKIKKDFEPEFEKHLDNFVKGSMFLLDKRYAEVEKQGGSIENHEAFQKKLMEDPAYKRVQEEIQTQGKAFSEKFKIKMFDVLTDEQWVRLQKLVDDPTEYGKILRTKLRKERGEREKIEVWAPGPNSWQPGDPIPEGYRQQRQERGRFPRVNPSE